MKTSIIKYITAIAFLVCVTSCKKTLDITNPNGPDETNFWKTGDDALAGVNAIY